MALLFSVNKPFLNYLNHSKEIGMIIFNTDHVTLQDSYGAADEKKTLNAMKLPPAFIYILPILLLPSIYSQRNYNHIT